MNIMQMPRNHVLYSRIEHGRNRKIKDYNLADVSCTNLQQLSFLSFLFIKLSIAKVNVARIGYQLLKNLNAL